MEVTGPLQTLLTDAAIRRLAGDSYYQRGVDYLRRALVDSLEYSENKVEAIVRGTGDYAVALSVRSSQLRYTCECPLGDEGAFCKHLVATALAWLAQQSSLPAGAPGTVRPRKVSEAEIKEALLAQEKETLACWLLEWSQEDKVVRQRLTTLACLRNDPETAAATLRLELQNAIQIRRFVEYREAGAYAGRVDAALDAVEAFLRQGHALPVIGLCESAMKLLEAALGNIDDSNGQGMELMERIAALHLAACEQAKSDPEALGARLFSLEVNARYGQWGSCAERYESLLGEAGLAAYKEAAAASWAAVPVRTVRESHTNGESYYSITRIMESLARQSGGVEQLVSVLERDLTSAHSYLRIAEAYRGAALHDKALHWAERGMALYPDRQGAALRLLAADEYRRMERHGDALRILWSEFRALADLEAYKRLEEFARAADDWEDWRDRALSHLRRGIDQRAAKASNTHDLIYARTAGHSLLVEICLHERNVEAAWQEAQTGGCHDRLWLQLAAECEQTHPEDAAGIYLRLGEKYATAITNGRYEQPIDLLTKAAALMHRLGRSPEFQLRIDALRLRLKAKRNLQKAAEASRHLLYLR